MGINYILPSDHSDDERIQLMFLEARWNQTYEHLYRYDYVQLSLLLLVTQHLIILNQMFNFNFNFTFEKNVFQHSSQLAEILI